MAQATYIYALVGNRDDATVLRYRTEVDAPLPGADVPTTPAVGPVVVERVEQDQAGDAVVLAYDPTPTPDEVNAALGEGWEHPPDGDPWAPLAPGAVARVHPQ
ncbi:MAG TPA: hypothetical protein VGQ45_11520 [Gaiellales bacterium]|jgi:hypothetical protein|nr:hypothetical protein [Gaiellales bacterium]